MTERNKGGRSTTASHPSATSYPTDVNIIERVWEVREGATPKAGLVLIHGGMWHSGWFGELGDLLSSSQYDIRVSAPDLLSHGLSDDVLAGYRNYVPNFTHHAVEVRAAIARARAALPDGTPVFALGESMGGLSVLQHLVIHEIDVDGVILCGAVLQIADALMPPRFMVPMLNGLGKLMPRIGVPGQDIGGDTFDRAFGDPAVGPVARADPLVADKVVPRLGVMTGALDAMDMVKREAPKKITVRLLAGRKNSKVLTTDVLLSLTAIYSDSGLIYFTFLQQRKRSNVAAIP